MLDVFFNFQIPQTPQYSKNQELYIELEQLYNAIRQLAEQISYLRYGINRGVGQLAGNELVVVKQKIIVKSLIPLQPNTLVHIRPTQNGELEAVIADITQNLWANGFTTSTTNNGQVEVTCGCGAISSFSGLVPGKLYYLSVAGTVVGAPLAGATMQQEIGIASDANTILWSFRPPIIV